MAHAKIRKYLERRADLTGRPLISGPWDNIEQVVVIPVLAERDYLFDTLESLCANPASELLRTLVICVVNNRAEPFTEGTFIEDNRKTLDALETLVRSDPSAPFPKIADSALRLGYVDASSPGREFPKKEGVGLARKIGLDWGLAVLEEGPVPVKLLLSLDADTRVEPNYLAAVQAALGRQGAWAGVVSYAHPFDAAGSEVAAILCYEFFLRYHVFGLRYAGSPYAFHSVGSTITCRAEAYVDVSGMNRRQGGEDFYFLQQLAKTGRVDRITATTVHPSSRPSRRVPFGTGPRVRRFLEGSEDEYRLYHPETYRVLKNWLSLVSERLEEDGEGLVGEAGRICPQLKAFLDAQNFRRVWRRLRENTAGPKALSAQFHRWFDGFRTLKLVHFLRDNGYPEQEMFESIACLLNRMGKTSPPFDPARIRHDLEQQKTLLHFLRDCDEDRA